MTRTQETADRAARELRDCLEPWAYAETRRQKLEEWRGHLAHALAEDRTGITRHEAQLVSLYARRELTDPIVQRAKRYTAALLVAYRELPTDYAEFLRFCERRALAAV